MHFPNALLGSANSTAEQPLLFPPQQHDALKPQPQTWQASSPVQILTAPTRKRKASNELADGGQGWSTDMQGGTLAERRKLSLPRCMPGSTQEFAQFMPLPEDVNKQMLAGLNLLPGQENALALHRMMQHASTTSPLAFPGSSNSPSSPASELHPGTPRDGFFRQHHVAIYPEFEIYPRSSSDDAPSRSRLDSMASTTASFGIFEPAAGASDVDGMALDEAEATQDGRGEAQGASAGHGPQCLSIPQLHVRNDGTSSELWARCPDCNAFTKVQESAPAMTQCYSP